MLLERLAQLVDRSSQPWPDIDRQISSWGLIAAVRALPARQRTLVALRFGADLDYAAVGQLVGLSALAARAATRRALLALRRDLERSGSL
ncbi:MAG: sigma factor-like helix-turn-helix DNA-binding protein [Candidatus Dormibacteraceae bacterium]